MYIMQQQYQLRNVIYYNIYISLGGLSDRWSLHGVTKLDANKVAFEEKSRISHNLPENHNICNNYLYSYPGLVTVKKAAFAGAWLTRNAMRLMMRYVWLVQNPSFTVISIGSSPSGPTGGGGSVMTDESILSISASKMNLLSYMYKSVTWQYVYNI